MSEILLQTTPVKMFEGKSSEKPGKARISLRTILSLRENINTQKIEKAIKRLNTIYTELISAVEISEKIKAEEEARKKMLGIAELEEKEQQAKTIFEMTESAVVNKRLKKATISLLKLAGRIGMYQGKFAIHVRKDFTQKPPKAINVKKLYSLVYKELMNKIELYEITANNKENIEEVATGQVAKPKSDGIPNWKKLFDGSNLPENINVDISKTTKNREEPIAVASSKLNEAELRRRETIAQLGDELETINGYKKNPVPSQFAEGIVSRAKKLRGMLLNIAGIDTDNFREFDLESVMEIPNTPFQDLIDKITGYQEAPTQEEHEQEQAELEEHYNRSDVQEKMNELMTKDYQTIFGEESGKNMEQYIERLASIYARDLDNGNMIFDNSTKHAISLAAKNAALDAAKRGELSKMSDDAAISLASKNFAVEADELNKMVNASSEFALELAASNCALDLNKINQVAEESYKEAISLAANNQALEFHELNQTVELATNHALHLAAQNAALDIDTREQIKEAASKFAIMLASESLKREKQEHMAAIQSINSELKTLEPEQPVQAQEEVPAPYEEDAPVVPSPAAKPVEPAAVPSTSAPYKEDAPAVPLPAAKPVEPAAVPSTPAPYEEPEPVVPFPAAPESAQVVQAVVPTQPVQKQEVSVKPVVPVQEAKPNVQAPTLNKGLVQKSNNIPRYAVLAEPSSALRINEKRAKVLMGPSKSSVAQEEMAPVDDKKVAFLRQALDVLGGPSDKSQSEELKLAA